MPLAIARAPGRAGNGALIQRWRPDPHATVESSLKTDSVLIESEYCFCNALGSSKDSVHNEEREREGTTDMRSEAADGRSADAASCIHGEQKGRAGFHFPPLTAAPILTSAALLLDLLTALLHLHHSKQTTANKWITHTAASADLHEDRRIAFLSIFSPRVAARSPFVACCPDPAEFGGLVAGAAGQKAAVDGRVESVDHDDAGMSLERAAQSTANDL